MSGGHFNFVGSAVQDGLETVANDERFKERFPALAQLLLNLGDWFYTLEHEVDWALGGDTQILNDAIWQHQQIFLLLEHVLAARIPDHKDKPL